MKDWIRDFVYKRRLKPFPYDLNFELTTECNMKCGYCVRGVNVEKGLKDSGHIEWKRFYQILEQFSHLPRYSHQKITPCGLGEPLLHPDILSMIRTIGVKMPKAELSSNTNGVLLDRVNLIESGLDYLTISINWSSRNEYLENNHVDHFGYVVKNTIDFLERKGSHKPSAIVQVMETSRDVSGFIKFWKPLLNSNDSILVRPFCNWGVASIENYLQSEPRFPCYALWSVVMVDKDGWVFPCCISEAYGFQSDLRLGNLDDFDLDELLRNGKLAEIREKHLRGEWNKLTPCKYCDAWSMMPHAVKRKEVV